MYDVLIVGGGLGGESLGKAMAEHGARVLIVERECQFASKLVSRRDLVATTASAVAVSASSTFRDHLGEERPL